MSPPQRTDPASPPIVAIVGAPNVGKSTLFNRLVRSRKAIVTDEPGVTRDRLYGFVEAGRGRFRLVDTGGLTPGLAMPFASEIRVQVETAVTEADVVLFVVDVRLGPTPLDQEIASWIRPRSARVLLAVNKVDGPAQEADVHAFHRIGFGEPIPVSAEQALGIEDLIERVLATLERVRPLRAEVPVDDPGVRVAIVGRPNVGKSSILNRLLGEDRVTVSEVPGTTRDAVDTRLEVDGRPYVLVDTAGIRRKGKVRQRAESLSVIRARKSIGRADVVVLVVDATQPLAAQDTHIAGYAREARKPLLVAVNKWDLVPEREEAAKTWEKETRFRLRFAHEVPVVLVSAKTGQRVSRILEHVNALHLDAGRRIPTPELNRWLREVQSRGRSASARGRKIRLFYATQKGIRPPHFLLFCNDARHVHFSLRRHLDNGLRERFGLGSVPIVLSFRSRREPR